MVALQRALAPLLCLSLLVPGAASGQVGPAAESRPPGAESSAPPVTIQAPEVVPESVVAPPPHKEPLPLPHLVCRRRTELLVGGLGLLAGVWIADRLLARDLSPSWEPWLPVVGPWYLLGEQAGLSRPIVAFLVLDGLAQLSGVTLAVLGLVLRGRHRVLSLPPRPAAVSFRPGAGPDLSFFF